MDLTVYDVALVPLVVGVIELFKRIGVPAKFSPLMSLAFGLGAGFVYVAPDDPRKAVLAGIVLALSATGLWSGAKNVKEGVRGR